MRHKLNIPDQPNVIFLVIVFDLFALIAVYGLYSSNWVGQSGQQLNLPQTDSAPLTISQNHITLKVFSLESAQCILGKKAIPFSTLAEELEKHRTEHAIEEVLLMIDTGATIEKEREVISIIQGLGLKCSIVAEPR